jgi:hypothetical protein
VSLFVFEFVPSVKAQEPQQNVFGNPSLPSWKNITVTVAGDGKSFTLDNADNLTWTFQYGANKYPSIYQNGVQIVKDELWMLQVYDGSWKDIGSSVNVFYKQVTSYNVAVTQTYTSKNGNYNVTWDFYGGFRPKISFLADITVVGTYRVDWRTYVYKDYAVNMTNYVKFWNGVEEAVVFDYSDVYEAFGNITMVEGVEGWVKGKRFDLIFNVGSLSVGVFRLDPNFGYETKGSSYDNIANQIKGSVFTITETGTAQNITVYLRQSSTNLPKVKCAIYKHSDLSLIAVTIEWTLTSGWDNWKTFSFASPPTLTINTAYVLVVWYNHAADIFYIAGDTNQLHYSDQNYDGFPNPWVAPTHLAYKISIYCSYTTGGAQEYSFEFSNTVSVSTSSQCYRALMFSQTETASIITVFSKGREFGFFQTETVEITTEPFKWGAYLFSRTETVTSTVLNNLWRELLFSFPNTIIIDNIFSKAGEFSFYQTETIIVTTLQNSWKELLFSFPNFLTITGLSQIWKELKITQIEFFEVVTPHSQTFWFTEYPPIDLALVLAAFAVVMAIIAIGLVATKKD